MNKKFKDVVQTQVVDRETGETTYVETQKSYTIQTTVDKFYMTFIEFAKPRLKIKFASDHLVLATLCDMATYNTGVVRITPQDRDEMSVTLELSKQQLTNSLTRLKKLDLITGDRGTFTINPQVFWKGDTKTRESLLKDEGVQIIFNITAK